MRVKGSSLSLGGHELLPKLKNRKNFLQNFLRKINEKNTNWNLPYLQNESELPAFMDYREKKNFFYTIEIVIKIKRLLRGILNSENIWS
jgi:hypothetical protein